MSGPRAGSSWKIAKKRFGATALVMEALGEPRVIASFGDPEPVLSYVSAAIATVAEAPRSAERSEGRRRLLLSLPRTLTHSRGGLACR